MTKFELKNKLLTSCKDSGCYIDNEYLDQYVDLITDYHLNTNGYCEKHHIQPRAYYKYNNLEIDNSESNLITLLYQDHIKAHYLLYFCTTGKLQQANAHAVRWCLSTIDIHLISDTLFTAILTQAQAYMDCICNDENSRYWTDSEIELLYSLKPKKSNNKEYDLESMFPGRSYDCILKKANALGISIKNLAWSAAEDEIIRQYYPLEGKDISKRLPNRTAAAIVRRATQLKIYHSRVWTAEEINILKTYYAIEGKNVANRFLDRTAASCKMKAQELGLKYHTGWTTEQLDMLKQLYPKIGASCGDIIGKAAEACRQKASKLGIKYLGDVKNQHERN